MADLELPLDLLDDGATRGAQYPSQTPKALTIKQRMRTAEPRKRRNVTKVAAKRSIDRRKLEQGSDTDE